MKGSTPRVEPATARANRLLRALPPEMLSAFCERLHPFEMTHGMRLFDADQQIDRVVFPLTGAVSLVAETSEGDTSDTRLVGPEGFVGLPVFLGTFRMPMRAVCQVPGHALAMRAEDFRELMVLDGVPDLLMYYTQMAMVELSQNILCNRVHKLEQRTARWLLELGDRVHEADFDLTQEWFAAMLGTSRPAVTSIVHALRERGLIDYARGRIQIVDRAGLEGVTCECFFVVRDELDRLIASEPVHS